MPNIDDAISALIKVPSWRVLRPCHAAMIHSSVNAGAAFPIYLVKAGYNPIIGPTMAGLLGGIPFVIAAVVLIVQIGKTRTLSAESLEVV